MSVNRKTKSQKLEDITQQIEKLRNQEKQLKAQVAQEKRKQTMKNTLALGKAVLDILGRDFIEGDVERFIDFLKNANENNEFTQAMMPSEGISENTVSSGSDEQLSIFEEQNETSDSDTEKTD
jgi:hypothetical protein